VFAVIAVIIALIAWAFQAIGDGVENPWAWLFAVLAFIGAHLVYNNPEPFRRRW
jgi:hypothetical protein